MQHHDESQNIMLKERSQTQKTIYCSIYMKLQKRSSLLEMVTINALWSFLGQWKYSVVKVEIPNHIK